MGEKTWSYTLNNWNEKEELLLQNMECNFHIYGREIGEEGTPHLQGTIRFKTSKRLAALKKVLPRAHWEKTIDFEASVAYCMKDQNYFLKDNRKQGKRNDLKEAIDVLVSTNKIENVKKEYPEVYVKYYRGLEKLIEQQDRNFKPYVEWIWGSTGVGKTRLVFEREPNLWISGRDLKNWENYENQEATLFDDFRGDFCTFHELLRILDRYPYTVNIKFGSKKLNSKRMYITSCYPPDQVYESREDINQLLRRIDKITHMT